MSNPMRYRPYYSDFSGHILRFFLARMSDPDPVPLEKLNECARQDLSAARIAMTEMNDYQKFIINECYSPVVPIQMFRIQLTGACEQLGIDESAGFAELQEALYRVAWHRGLIGVPYKKYKHLYEKEQGETT